MHRLSHLVPCQPVCPTEQVVHSIYSITLSYLLSMLLSSISFRQPLQARDRTQLCGTCALIRSGQVLWGPFAPCMCVMPSVRKADEKCCPALDLKRGDGHLACACRVLGMCPGAEAGAYAEQDGPCKVLQRSHVCSMVNTLMTNNSQLAMAGLQRKAWLVCYARWDV